MAAENEVVAMIDKSIARYSAEVSNLEKQLKTEAGLALEDWLLMEACKDYDTIELEADVTGKARRKSFKAMREKKRNLEKMIAALQDLRETAATAGGEKLRKKFSAETEKYE